MNYKEELDNMLTHGATKQEALDFLDKLPPISINDMMGKWKAIELSTGHPAEGMLIKAGWYGKKFITPEDVHPMLFFTAKRDVNELVSIDPLKLEVKDGNFLTAEEMPSAVTTEGKARLRMLEFKGKVSASMIYDELPINDIFRRVDENRVFGVVDSKGLDLAYFFVLEKVL